MTPSIIAFAGSARTDSRAEQLARRGVAAAVRLRAAWGPCP